MRPSSAARWLGRLLALPAWQLLHVTQLIIKLTGDSNSSNNNGVPHCNQCESEWVARPRSRIPVQCPRCKRVDWAEPKKGIKNASIIHEPERGVRVSIGAADRNRKQLPVRSGQGDVNAPVVPGSRGNVLPPNEPRPTSKPQKEVASTPWYPQSKCPHNWMNSFVCEQNGGGCHR